MLLIGGDKRTQTADIKIARAYLTEFSRRNHEDQRKQGSGGISAIAERTGLSRETLYRTLSERGNLRLSSLSAMLQATGLKLAVAPA